MVAPLDDILKTVCSVFFERQFQFCELTYWIHKTYCSPSATTKSSSPPNQEQPGKLDGALTFVPLCGSQTFLLQNAVWKRCKTKLLNCKKKKRAGRRRRKKKQKAAFPLLIEFKGITCSTLQQMGSYTNFKAIKRYKVPCGAGLHWS